MDKEKKIEVGTSSLVDLKAELHRKQQESRTLHRGADRPTSSKASSKLSGKSKVWSKANAGVEQRDQRNREEVEQENKDLDRSRTVLEAKARVYDRLRTGTEALEDDATNERFLVNFQQKAIDDVTQRRQAAEEKSSAELPPDAAGDEWVEFTDSLGRSRTVMRRDLAEYQRRDQEGRRTKDDQQNQTPELMSEDARREQQRLLWEQQELENAAKRDIHYQDVLFNEARAHGAGYFAFSQDAEERARQQAELDQLRDHTQTQQNRAQRDRKRKNAQLKERLRKVRERKRLRLGLPIEDRLEKQESGDEEQEEGAPAAATQLTPEEISRRLQEQRKEHDRQAFVREWDLGKQGVANKKTVLTQEQWVEQQRKDRPAEFAPPAQYEPRGRGRPAAGSVPPQPGPRTSVTQGTECPSATELPSAGQEAPPRTERPPETSQHPLPAVSVCRDLEPAPTNTGQPLNWAQPPPIIGYPPLSTGHPPPEMGQPLSNFGPPPPSIGHPPPSTDRAPPDLSQPPPGFVARPAGSGPVSLPGWPVSSGDRAGSLSSAARPARPPSYRARQAAAADLTDPDCVPPAGAGGRGAGVEVEPPPTAEYYGGARRGRRPPPAARPDVGSAIEAGLALLSQDTEHKHSKTFDL